MTYDDVGLYVAQKTNTHYAGVEIYEDSEGVYPLFSFRIEATFFIAVWGRKSPAEAKESIPDLLTIIGNSIDEWLMGSGGSIQ